MPKYVVLYKFTEQGAKEMKSLPDRSRAAQAALEQAGGKVLGWYLTEGQYDVVTIVETPDEETMAIGAMAIAAAGNSRPETLRAFDLSEAEQLIQRIP